MRLLPPFAALFHALLQAFARALSPPACAACDAANSAAAVFCAACARDVLRDDARGVARAAPRVVAFGVFAGALALAIRRLKYADRPDLARPLGHLLRLAARGAGLRGDLVVPVPLHPRRLAERGYNQAALVAAHVAAELGAPLAARALVRGRDTAQQARLDRGARLENVAGAFRVRDPARVRGRDVVVVDDVFTTGATLDACCEALRAAGAASVTCLVIARAGGAAGPRA